MKKTDSQKITLRAEVEERIIFNLLCCAFEGGSNYWIHFADIKKRAKPGTSLIGLEGDNNVYLADHCIQGAVHIIPTDEQSEKTITMTVLKEGLQTMLYKYPKHWANAMTEDTDATTGDIFLQCCMFGEVIFG